MGRVLLSSVAGGAFLFASSAVAQVPGAGPASQAATIPYVAAYAVGALGTDSSIAGLASGRLSASGLVDVLSYAGGIPINDGAAHTVGTAPAGSIFSGVTTLSGLASIQMNGTTPFGFLVDNGAVTGPMGTPGSASNPFTSTGGAYRLTNASVSSLDIAWLAIQAAVLQGRTYLPAGKYVIGSGINLPVMMPLSFENGPVAGNGVFTMLVGDGARVSTLYAPRDFGPGVPLLVCGDPAATAGSGLGRYNNVGMCSGDLRSIGLFNAGLFYPSANATGYAMTGIASGARLRTADVESSGFGVDFDLVGDHVLHQRLHLFGGAKGLRFSAPNGNLVGDVQFTELNASGQSIASIAVAPGASISGHFTAETYLSGEYGILGEAATGAGCTPILNGVIFEHLMSEYIGEGTIVDDSGFSGGTGSGSYTDANKCRAVQKLDVGEWFNSFDNSKADTTGSGRGRRATVDVAQLDMRVTRLLVDGGSPTPNVIAAPNAAAVPPVAFLNVRGVGTNFGGIDLEGDINGLIALSGTLPMVAGVSDSAQYASTRLAVPGAWSGSIALVNSAGSYTTTAAGDPMEAGYFATILPAGTSLFPNGPVVGIAMQGGMTSGQSVPVASSGSVRVNVGWSSPSLSSLLAKSTGIGRTLILAGGSGYTNGTYAWSSTGGGCTAAAAGTVVVTGGVLTSFTISNPGAGCTSAPAIAVPPGAGRPGTAGSITANWPSATALVAATPMTAGYIGVAQNAGNSGPTGATSYIVTRLSGLQ